MAEVWRAYEDFLTGNRLTINLIIDEYLKLPAFRELKATTRKDYEGAIDKLRPVFGHMNPVDLSPTLFTRYMFARSSQKRANVERTVLMNVYKWAINFHDEIKDNPIQKTVPFKMKARDRYITDKEYQAIWKCASKPVRVAMDLSYLLGARQGDILKLKWKDITEEGVYIEQSKTGKKQIKEMNDDLKRVLSNARNTGGIASAMYVVSNRSGQSYTASGFRAMFKKAKIKAGIKDVTYHDIKAKSLSDYKGNKQGFSGHKTRSMMERYNRTPDKVKSGEFKK